MTTLLVVAAVAVWFGVGAVGAACSWRRGEFDIGGDTMCQYEHGVVDKLSVAWVVTLCGPIFPLADALSALNERTKPSRKKPKKPPTVFFPDPR